MSFKKDLPFILSFLLIGLFLRLILQGAMQWSFDSDEAIVGLMAKHINENGQTPIFYYGQHYMGTLEPLLVSFAQKIIGVNVFSLRSVPTLFYLLLFPLIYSFGARLGGIQTARASIVLLALSPNSFAEWSIRARGGFIEIVFLAILALYLTGKVEINKNHESKFLTFLIALVLGFGWWTNNQIIFAIAPIGVFFLCHIFFLKEHTSVNKIFLATKYGAIGSFGFLLGSLPFWIYNLKHNFASFGMFRFAEDLAKNLEGFFFEAVPIVLGIKRFWTSEEVFSGELLIGSIVYICVLLGLIGALFKKSSSNSSNKVRQHTDVLLLIGFILFVSVIFVVSSFGSLYAAPRYLLPIYPALYLLIGYSLFGDNSPLVVGRYRIVASVIFFAIIAINLATYFKFMDPKQEPNSSSLKLNLALATPGEPFVFEQERASRSHIELIDWLKAENYTFVKTNYWIGYRLALETNETVKFVQFGDPFHIRIDSYEEEGKGLPANRIPMVLTPLQALVVQKGLAITGYTFNRISLSGYEVLYDINELHGSHTADNQNLKLISKEALQLEANKRAFDLNNILDHNLATRWGTGEHQQKGQYIKVRFNQPQPLKAIVIETAHWKSDYPRMLKIECVLPASSSTSQPSESLVDVLLDESQSKTISYVFSADDIKLQFKQRTCTELILKQDGYHPILDWSIAELKLYQ